MRVNMPSHTHTPYPLIQWLKLLPSVVAALALITLEGVINEHTISLASQCQDEREWEFDFHQIYQPAQSYKASLVHRYACDWLGRCQTRLSRSCAPRV